MNNLRNSLTIAETREYLCPEHAGRLFAAECWWAIVPSGDNNPNSFASTGDSSAFWALVDANNSMGMPLGYVKGTDFLGRDTNKPHNDPETLLKQLIKPNIMMDKPNKAIITARAAIAGQDPDKLFELRVAEYNAKIEADQNRINHVINAILGQRLVTPDEHQPWDDLEDESGRLRTGGEWEIPIDRIIEFGEKQLKFMATNVKIQDTLFEAERLIWKDEIEHLTKIVQQRENEGAGEGSREIDNALLDNTGLAQAQHAGK